MKFLISLKRLYQNYTFLKFDYKLKYFNVAISEIIQGTSDWNCFIKGSDATTLFTDNKTYRKHIDIYD